MRVLVVDTYPDSADTLAALIGHWGHKVRACYSLAEALTATSFRARAVVIDLGNHAGKLAEGAGRLHRPGIELVALVNDLRSGDAQRLRQAGFCTWLVKPVDPSALRMVLGTLQRKSARRRGKPSVGQPVQ